MALPATDYLAATYLVSQSAVSVVLFVFFVGVEVSLLLPKQPPTVFL